MYFVDLIISEGLLLSSSVFPHISSSRFSPHNSLRAARIHFTIFHYFFTQPNFQSSQIKKIQSWLNSQSSKVRSRGRLSKARPRRSSNQMRFSSKSPTLVFAVQMSIISTQTWHWDMKVQGLSRQDPFSS